MGDHAFDRTKRQVYLDQVRARFGVVLIEFMMAADLTQLEGASIVSDICCDYVGRILRRERRRNDT